MILRMNKAILHVFDFVSCVNVMSKAELDLEDKTVRQYVSGICRKAMGATDAHPGRFERDSPFATRISRWFHGQEDFIKMTGEMADFLGGELAHVDQAASCDLLCADFTDGDDERWFGLFLLDIKKAFTHDVSGATGSPFCDVVRRNAVLPAATQKLGSWALVRASDLAVRVVEPVRQMDGADRLLLQQQLLSCTTEASSKEALDAVREMVEEVADEHGANAALALSRAKAYVTEHVDSEGSFSCEGLAEEVFADSEPARRKLELAAEVRKLPADVQVDRRAVDTKAMRNHRIVTDTGIEISYPAELGENPDFIRFESAPDGSISIELLNIGKIENK